MNSPITSILAFSFMASCLSVSAVDPGDNAPQGEPGFQTAHPWQQKPKPRFGKGFAPRRGEEAFSKADQNKDGRLSLDEFSSTPRLEKLEQAKKAKLFDFLDSNRDGFLQLSELKPKEPGLLRDLRAQFTQLDGNRDGALDQAEFSAFRPRMKEDLGMLFKRLDRDNNGKITRFEMSPASLGGGKRKDADFKSFDINSSGSLDFAEFSAVPWISKWPEPSRRHFFDHVDGNADGELSKDEIRAAHEAGRPGQYFKNKRMPGHGRPPHHFPPKD